MSRLASIAIALSAAVTCGCLESPGQKAPPAQQQVQDDGKGIIGKTTQEVGKYDPADADLVVSDQKINAKDPFSAPLYAYSPIVESAAIQKIKADIEIFNVTENHYPNYEEFMEKIIKVPGVRLPVLPWKGRYMYNEETHELLVVRDPENAKKLQ